jgi:hypothetical protein
MLMLLDALTAERDKRRQSFREEALQRQLSREVLHRLGECLTAAQLPRWYFIPNGDEIVVVHNKDGAGNRHRIGAWTVDEEYRLAFGSERTEWVTPESWARVIDRAVMITAQVILDHDVQVNPESSSAYGGRGSAQLGSSQAGGTRDGASGSLSGALSGSLSRSA